MKKNKFSNDIKVSDDFIEIEPSSVSEMLGFQGILRIPLLHIREAYIDAEIMSQNKGLRAPGTETFNRTVGTFRRDGLKTYFNIKRGEIPLVLQLFDEEYDRLVLGCKEPKRVIAQIQHEPYEGSMGSNYLDEIESNEVDFTPDINKAKAFPAKIFLTVLLISVIMTVFGQFFLPIWVVQCLSAFEFFLVIVFLIFLIINRMKSKNSK